MNTFGGVSDWVVPVALLADFLGLTERRVQQLAVELVIPVPEGGRYKFLESVKGYNSYLQQCAAGKAVSDEAKEKQAAQIGLLQAQRDSAQMAVDVKRGALVPADQVRSLTVQLIRVLSEGADGLADLLERKAGLSGEALVQVATTTDQWRMRLYDSATQALGGEVIADEPAADKPRKKPTKKQIKELLVHAPARVELINSNLDDAPKRRRGRPRLVQKDSFTPDLI